MYIKHLLKLKYSAYGALIFYIINSESVDIILKKKINTNNILLVKTLMFLLITFLMMLLPKDV